LTPVSVSLEFLAWFVWLAAFALMQYRLCARYPGIRTLCRTLYTVTALVAVGPAVWALTKGGRGTQLLAQVNHAFGLGVYAQTFLRASLLFRWLAWPGVEKAVGAVGSPATRFESEARLVGVLVALTHQARRGLRQRKQA
jgi:hypothetical protein